MKFTHSVTTALNGLRTHKSRSALTILGIVIGITAIILVMSVGQGARDLILAQIQGLGSQTIVLEPGREPTGPSEFSEIFTDTLKLRDVEALQKPANVQGVKGISPNVIQVVPVSYGNESTRVNVLGAGVLIKDIFEFYPEVGAFFTEEDIQQKASVAVIGSEVKERLFGESDAFGQRIKIKDRSFRVVGVLAPKGQVAAFNADEMVVIPYSTAQQYLLGISHFHSIIIRAESEEIVPRVVSSIKLTVRETHGITDPDKDDFHVTTQADAAARVATVTGILTALLTSVAAISLVVGGIGIMNIMLVSVSERTREIGLRKALGATEGNILTQFLLEAVMLTGAGGVVGILLGAGFSFLISLVLARTVASGWGFSFPIAAAVLGLGVSAGVGLIFGLYPARQASRKSPIEALRYE